MMNLYSEIPLLLKTYPSVALCTIVHTKGSTPMKNGSKIIVCPDKKIIGTIGGGALEYAVIKDALKCIENSESKLFEHHLTKDHQMCCGGTVSVFIEIIKSFPKLYIFGAGHVGSFLATVSSLLQFDTYLIDDREFILSQFKMQDIFNNKVTTILHSPVEYIQSLPIENTNDNFCVIVTYNHQIDREILLGAISKKFKYIGMIGSKRKVFITRKFLHHNNISENDINKIDMPIGIDIHAYYPEEIAVSILAKIISCKHQTHSIPCNTYNSDTFNSIHEEYLNNISLCIKKL